MENKRITFFIVLLFLIAGAIGFFLIEHEIKNPDVEKPSVGIKSARQRQESSNLTADKPCKNAQKADLYSDSGYYLPLMSIVEIASLDDNAKRTVNEIFELSQGFYYLKRNSENGRVFLILQNPIVEIENRYPRHNMQMADIHSEGHTEYLMFGYNGQEDEIENAVVSQKGETWVFDESVEPFRPLSHIVYDKRKKILFSETWNYDEGNPVKYEMKNASGNVVSVMKETVDGDMSYRQEHIFYDDNGNIRKSLTIHYEGADLKWFTYYDSLSPENSVTIESEYENGMKILEKIYNSEYKLIYTIKAQYNDGIRTRIELYDADGKEISALVNQ